MGTKEERILDYVHEHPGTTVNAALRDLVENGAGAWVQVHRGIKSLESSGRIHAVRTTDPAEGYRGGRPLTFLYIPSTEESDTMDGEFFDTREKKRIKPETKEQVRIRHAEDDEEEDE